MHEQALERVAHAGTLHLAVVYDVKSLRKIGAFVDEGVTHALVVLEHGHGGLTRHRAHQRLAAAGNEHVHVFVEAAQLGNRVVGGDVDELHRVRRKSGRVEGFVQKIRERHVGMEGFGAAAQHDRVARLEAQNGGVHGHVGPRLVHHGHHAERHAHPAHEQTVGPLPLGIHGAHGIGHVGDVAAGFGHVRQNGRRETQSVHARSVETRAPGRVEILSVGVKKRAFLFL